LKLQNDFHHFCDWQPICFLLLCAWWEVSCD
jgi:hypothetical protein